MGGSVIAQQVRLRHLASLWSLLQQCSSVDPFETVLDSYKAPLTPAIEAELTAAAKKMDLEELLPALQNFIIINFTSVDMTWLTPDIPLYDHLSCADTVSDTLSALPWFVNSFPKEMKMKYTVAAYMFLASM